MKNLIVISLGGSLIIPDKVDYHFLNEFKSTLRSLYKTHKFVIVCGGGSIARDYIKALKKEHKSLREQSLAGIRATRENARFIIQFFGKEANSSLPLNMKEVKSALHKNSVVICGALRYAEKETSDGTAAKLSHYLNCKFINLTNVSGLYTSDPKKNKNARFIEKISWNNFQKMANKLKYSAGQHFVLDQSAAKIIKKKKTTTYILGSNITNLKNLLQNKKFKGTTISG